MASLLSLLAVAASAGEPRRLEWKPKPGDRYDVSITSAITTEDTTQGHKKETSHTASLLGEIRIVDVGSDGAKGVLRLRSLQATFKRGDDDVRLSLDEGDLKRATIEVKIDGAGVLSVDDADLDRVARGVELAVHFAGLFFRLPEDPVKEDQEWNLDKGPISLHLRLRDIRNEGEDELAIFEGEARAKESRDGARATARGQVAAEFNVTQGYLRLLDEDYSTKLTTGAGKVSLTIVRRVTVTKTNDR